MSPAIWCYHWTYDNSGDTWPQLPNIFCPACPVGAPALQTAGKPSANRPACRNSSHQASLITIVRKYRECQTLDSVAKRNTRAPKCHIMRQPRGRKNPRTPNHPARTRHNPNRQLSLVTIAKIQSPNRRCHAALNALPHAGLPIAPLRPYRPENPASHAVCAHEWPSEHQDSRPVCPRTRRIARHGHRGASLALWGRD